MSARVGVVFGTRPEIIKLAPVIRRLGDRAICIFTGQHYDTHLVDAIFRSCGIPAPQRRLVGVGGTHRINQVATMLTLLGEELPGHDLASVIIQGDTNSANAGAQAAHYLDIPVVHVEAGLRSYDRAMPEEINRLVISMLADVHCCPTPANADNLRQAGVPAAKIHVTGNPIVESTLAALPEPLLRELLLTRAGLPVTDFALATFHRPENTDDERRLCAILHAIGSLSRPVVLPLHPRTAIRIRQAGIAVPANVQVTAPLDYPTFLSLTAQADLVVSDSGGLQEEVTVLKKPMVVVRRSTERPEAVAAGFCEMAEPEEIGDAARRLLQPVHLAALATRPSPFGDDEAGARIVELALSARDDAVLMSAGARR